MIISMTAHHPDIQMVWTATNSKSGNEKFFKLTVSSRINLGQSQMHARPLASWRQLSCRIACARTNNNRRITASSSPVRRVKG